ncbi:MAG: M23 family metallopeptidase [Cyanothece sp. SIO1E1]|nr:M23 family metallopeptidase [Cyanothece sp. SIO1E1]
MRLLRWLFYSIVAGLLLPAADVSAQSVDATLCPAPALSRLSQHTIAAGETIADIANRYNLIPATLMGLNPSLRNGQVPVGAKVVIPPYNGIKVEVPAGKTWQDVATSYNVRADVLFEINGCQPVVPPTIFVTGVNWSPANSNSRYGDRPQAPNNHGLQGYPLASTAPVALGYGWQVHPNTGDIAFNSGVDLKVTTVTPVLSVGAGTVAFAGRQGDSNLIVINHSQGLQSRYANLSSIQATVGQSVRPGTQLGSIDAANLTEPAYLHFEIRSNSNLGWVAQDPQLYIPSLKFRQ